MSLTIMASVTGVIDGPVLLLLRLLLVLIHAGLSVKAMSREEDCPIQAHQTSRAARSVCR